MEGVHVRVTILKIHTVDEIRGTLPTTVIGTKSLFLCPGRPIDRSTRGPWETVEVKIESRKTRNTTEVPEGVPRRRGSDTPTCYEGVRVPPLFSYTLPGRTRYP